MASTYKIRATHLTGVSIALPNDVVRQILLFLDLPSLSNCFSVCKTWQYVLSKQDDIFWRKFLPQEIIRAQECGCNSANSPNPENLRAYDIIRLFKFSQNKVPVQAKMSNLRNCPINPYLHTSPTPANFNRLLHCYFQFPLCFFLFSGYQHVEDFQTLIRSPILPDPHESAANRARLRVRAFENLVQVMLWFILPK